MPYTGRIHVMLKPGVLDPQGDTVAGSLHALGYAEVQRVRIGKYMEVALEAASAEAARERLDNMCRQLLANPVIEEYRLEVVSG